MGLLLGLLGPLALLGGVVPAVEVVLHEAASTVTTEITVAVLIFTVHVVVYTADRGAVVETGDSLVVAGLVVLLESLAEVAGHGWLMIRYLRLKSV